jgi:class 3 adenylate cyclase
MDAIEKDNLRLTRRLRRLESNMEQLEEMRETNARLMDQLLADLAAERQRSESLLLNVLPQRIVDRLHAGETTIADRHDDVAVVFCDFVGFTDLAARTPAPRLVGDLNALFSAFDAACDRHGVEKIKTIGDAYLAVAGLSAEGVTPQGVTLDDVTPQGVTLDDVTPRDPAVAAADAALEMRAATEATAGAWGIRIGIEVGPVVAGVIGTAKFAYDVWGDAVNTASRLETSAPPGAIQVSDQVAQRLAGAFDLTPVGIVDLKGKGPTRTWLLAGRSGPT